VLNANVNLVRIWGGGLAETDDFYELRIVMDWAMAVTLITGDTHENLKVLLTGPGGEVFKKNIISTIYWIRNHASLLV
jgi:hypothetical protein